MIPGSVRLRPRRASRPCDRAPRQARGREAPRRRALALACDEAAHRAARAARGRRPHRRPLVRARGGRHDRDRRLDPPQGPRRVARAARELRNRGPHGRPGRRPAGAPPRNDRRIARARRSRVGSSRGDPRVARRDGRPRPGGRSGDTGARVLHRRVPDCPRPQTRCWSRSGCRSSTEPAGRTRR